MKLYTSPYSSNARKAVMASLLLELPLEHVVVNLGQGEQRKPEYLAIHPGGRVPALVDGDLALSESNAIMIYLAGKKPGNTLYPTAAKAKATVDQWLFWQSSHWSPAISGLTFENLLKGMFGMGEPDPAHVKRNEDFVRKFGAELDAHLARSQWIASDTLTLADVAIAVPLMYTVPSRLPVDGFANLQAWFGRVRELDAWKQTEPPPMTR